MRAAFTGHQPLMFTDYVDLATGRVLSAEPGGVYDIAPASGRAVPEMPGNWFVPVEAEQDQPEPQAAFEPDTGED